MKEKRLSRNREIDTKNRLTVSPVEDGRMEIRMKELLSVIIPCYNEEKVIKLMADTIENIFENQEFDYEIIFVNDGSKDNTVVFLKEISEKYSKMKYISFSRNFGKEAAMLAGLQYCKGTCAVIMDADLQHPPELIRNMYEEYKKGYDQVIAKRNRKGDSRVSSLFAKLYYRLANKLVNVEIVDGAGDFRLLSRRAIDALLSLKENNRFSKGLFSWIGFHQTYIEYENQARKGGESKWSFKSLLSYGVDGVLSFNNQPLRLCVYLGGIFSGISILYLLYLFVQILFYGIDVPGYFTIILLVTSLGGIQLLSIGIIGEYIGRIYFEVKKRPCYLIQELNLKETEE